MRITRQTADWLETHWVAPAYKGWLLAGLAIFFFGAATNTMAGWLYVLSGILVALLSIAALLPPRALSGLKVRRRPIEPISVGDQITLELEIKNSAREAATLLQIRDMMPLALGQPIPHAIEIIPPQGVYRWTYSLDTQRRGVYPWSEVQLRTATPFGLFWCRRSRTVKAVAVVYPTVLPLTHCPLVDQLGQEYSPLFHESRYLQMATEGITRTLRPYRYGDSTRLIHWRSSARYGELRVRELEISTGGQEIVIGIDSAAKWDFENFEQAVIAAASLYSYADRRQLNVNLWTATTGLVHGSRVVLEILAAIQDGETAKNHNLNHNLPTLPLIWLTQNPHSLNSLPKGSRWVLWPTESPNKTPGGMANFAGLEIQPHQPLEMQLQHRLGIQ